MPYSSLSLLKRFSAGVALIVVFVLGSCDNKESRVNLPVHRDVPFVQDFSVKYLLHDSIKLLKVGSDRNGVVEVATSQNLHKPHAGQFLVPGKIVRERYYRPTADKQVGGLTIYRDHFVYVDDKAVFSNAWAGNLFVRHTMPKAFMLAGGKDFDFIISDGKDLQYLKDSVVAWKGTHPSAVLDMIFDSAKDRFLVLSPTAIHSFSPAAPALKKEYDGVGLSAFALSEKNGLVVGTSDGYFILDPNTFQQKGETVKALPWIELTAVEEIDGRLWFGSTRGAFATRDDGKYDYYASKRWLPSDKVVDIAKGPEN